MPSRQKQLLLLVLGSTACLCLLAVLSTIGPWPGPLSIGEVSAAPLPPPRPPGTEPDNGDEKPKKPGNDDKTDETSGLRKLSKQEINRIRYLELRGIRLKDVTARPDMVTAKISKEVVEQFLQEMQSHPAFTNEQSRRDFNRLTAPQKLHQIAFYKGASYADRVEVLSDPEVFVGFKKNVLPPTIRACARAGCHNSAGSDEKVRFRLFNDPKHAPSTTYADFVMLNDVRSNGGRVIDRAHPENSLLLTYMLPAQDVAPELRHPGNIEMTPVFHTTQAIGYRRILKWISSLKHPAEDYGVHLFAGAEEPAATTGEGELPPPGPQKPEAEPEKGEPKPPQLPSGPTSGPADGGQKGGRGPG